MVEFEINLSDNDYDRLYVLKEKENKGNLTGNEFAAELLSEVLRIRVPKLTKQEEECKYDEMIVRLVDLEKRAEEIIGNTSLTPYQKDVSLAALMTEMEGQYGVPILKDSQWESENKEIFEVYKKISDMRSL